MEKLSVKDVEHVLLCDSTLIQRILGENVIVPISKKLITMLADPSAFWFGPRQLIETDTKYIQLVSYIIIEHGNQVLCYQRGDDSQEQRLKNKLSIGLGGHISLRDMRLTNGILDVMKTIKAGATREVREELEVHKVVSKKKLVLIHSELNTVDEVHCGFIEVWKVESPQKIVTREKALKTIGFRSLSELAVIPRFESWSTLLIQYLSNVGQSVK